MRIKVTRVLTSKHVRYRKVGFLICTSNTARWKRKIYDGVGHYGRRVAKISKSGAEWLWYWRWTEGRTAKVISFKQRSDLLFTFLTCIQNAIYTMKSFKSFHNFNWEYSNSPWKVETSSTTQLGQKAQILLFHQIALMCKFCSVFCVQ